MTRTTKHDARSTGQRIRAAREAAGLTQTQLAEAAGIVQPEISKMERGAIEPTLPTLRRLAGALRVRAGDLVGDAPA